MLPFKKEGLLVLSVQRRASVHSFAHKHLQVKIAKVDGSRAALHTSRIAAKFKSGMGYSSFFTRGFFGTFRSHLRISRSPDWAVWALQNCNAWNGIFLWLKPKYSPTGCTEKSSRRCNTTIFKCPVTSFTKKPSISIVCLICIKKDSEENMRAFIKAKSAEKDPNVCKKQLNKTRVTEKNQKVTVKATCG